MKPVGSSAGPGCWAHAFPQKAEDCSSLALGCNATRCAARGKEVWQSELTAGINGTGLRQRGRIDDNTFYKFSLESIRHGAKGLLYWQYRKERFGSEFGGFAMTDYAGGPTNLSRCAEKLCSMLQKNEDIFNHYHQDQARVALVFSIRSYLANWVSEGRGNNKYAVDSINGYYRMMWEENIITDVIHEDFFDDLSQYNLIILPSPYALSEKMAEALKAYIKNGGTVLSDPYFGAFDKDMKLARQVPGFGFAEIFGCEEDDICQQPTVLLKGKDGTCLIEGNNQMETFRHVTADALYSYEDGSPAILSKAYGKGRALISGVNLGLSYSTRALVGDDFTSQDQGNSSLGAKEIVMKLCRECGVPQNPCTAEGVKVSILKTEGEADGIVLINSLPAPARGVLSLDASYASARTILGSAPCALEKNGLSFTLQGDESAVIRLQK